MPVSFDTLRAATRLREEAGFSEQQARVLISTIADGMDEHLATKDDIAALSQRIDALDQKLDQRIDALDQKLDQRINALDQKLDQRIDELDQKIDQRIVALDQKIDQRIVALDQKLDQRIVALDQKLDQRTVALDQKLDLSVAGLEHSMAAMEQRLLVRVGSMVAAATVIGVAAVGVLVSAT